MVSAGGCVGAQTFVRVTVTTRWLTMDAVFSIRTAFPPLLNPPVVVLVAPPGDQSVRSARLSAVVRFHLTLSVRVCLV